MARRRPRRDLPVGSVASMSEQSRGVAFTGTRRVLDALMGDDHSGVRVELKRLRSAGVLDPSVGLVIGALWSAVCAACDQDRDRVRLLVAAEVDALEAGESD